MPERRRPAQPAPEGALLALQQAAQAVQAAPIREFGPVGNTPLQITRATRPLISALAKVPKGAQAEAVAGLEPLPKLFLYAERPVRLLARPDPAGEVLALVEQVRESRPKLAGGLLWLCARAVWHEQGQTGQQLALRLMLAAARDPVLPIEAFYFADAIVGRAGATWRERLTLLGQPRWVLAHSEPLAPLRKVARLVSPADLPGVLEELAQAIERYPRNTDIEVGHDRAELARQIRALAG